MKCIITLVFINSAFKHTTRPISLRPHLKNTIFGSQLRQNMLLGIVLLCIHVVSD